MALALSPENESLVRAIIWQHWREYFPERREKILAELDENTTPARAAELKSTGFYRRKEALDLSGACKLVAQVAFKSFSFNGKVFTNRRHTFVLLDSGQVYDMNRYCQDVANMWRKDRNPYELDIARNTSKEGQKGLKSWNDRVNLLVSQVEELAPSLPRHKGKPLNNLPTWATIRN